MKEISFNNDCNQLLKRISILAEGHDIRSGKIFQGLNSFIDRLENENYQATPDGGGKNALFILNPDTLKIIWTNSAGIRILGVLAEKALAETFDSFLSDESKAGFHGILDKIKAGELSLNGELAFVRNGSVPLMASASVETITGRGASPEILVSVSSNADKNGRKFNPSEIIRKMELEIRERMEIEKTLNETNQTLRTIINSINGYIILIDKDFNILDISGNLLSLYGIPDKASVLGKKCYDAFKCRKIPCRSCPVPETLSNKIQVSKIVTSRKGRLAERTFKVSTSPVKDKDGNIWAIISSVIDVTELQETQDVLLRARDELEARINKYNCELSAAKNDLLQKINEKNKAEEDKNLFFAAIEQSAEGILITDSNGIIEYSNPAYEKISGYSPGELRGCVAGAFAPDGKNVDRKILGPPGVDNVWNSHLKKKRKDRADIEVDLTVSPIRNSGGEINNYIIIEQDVTEKAKLERQLMQSQKMEAIGTLAGGIAHDFNNILMALTANAEMAAEHARDETAKRYLERIVRGAERAKDLVKQILTFSRQTECRRQPLQVQSVIKEALKLIRATLPSSIEIRQNIAPDTGMALADPGEIHQVIMNLCSNAAHAMKNTNGILSVEMKNVTVAAADSARLKNLKAGGYIELAVSDNGHGIGKDIIDRIFEPFFTTKKVGEGTGLGLSVVHGIISGLKGEITVESEAGRGATFRIYIPRIETPAVDDETRNIPLPAGNGENILFVDDEEALVEVVRDILLSLNYKVSTAVNGNDALKLFKSDPGKFSLAIIDQTMPGINGSKLFIEIKNVRNDIPVMLCTGYSDSINSELASKMGIEMFLVKPVAKRGLAFAIDRLLKK